MRTYGKNGGEKQLAQMLRQPAEGVEERFAFLYKDADCESLFAEAPGLRMHRLWPFELRPRHSPWLELLVLLPVLPWMQIRLLALLLMTRSRVCIVHGFQAALVAWPAAVLLRGIGFGYLHRTTKSSTGRNSAFRLVYAPFRKLVGVSRAVAASLSGLAPDFKLMAIENGVDIERVRRAVGSTVRADRSIVISVGRLLPNKGQRMIIESFGKCCREFPYAELWIVGEGENRVDLEEAVTRHGLGERIRFLGRREDVPELLASATVFVHASEWEGLSNAVLEGMAAGLPSVVVDAPGVTECHDDGRTGFVVSRSVEELAMRLALLLRDPDLRKRMGVAASQHVESRYSVRANREKYLDLYRQLAGIS